MSPRERIAQLTAEAELNLKPASLDRLDDAALPPVYTAPRQELSIVVDEEIIDNKDQLTSVVTKAIKFLDEMLDMDVGEISTETARGLSLQLQAAQTAITTQTKVDDTQLRRRQVDMLPKLLEMMEREEKRLPVLELSAS